MYRKKIIIVQTGCFESPVGTGSADFSLIAPAASFSKKGETFFFFFFKTSTATYARKVLRTIGINHLYNNTMRKKNKPIYEWKKKLEKRKKTPTDTFLLLLLLLGPNRRRRRGHRSSSRALDVCVWSPRDNNTTRKRSDQSIIISQ